MNDDAKQKLIEDIIRLAKIHLRPGSEVQKAVIGDLKKITVKE